MQIVFCGLVPPELPAGHRAIKVNGVNELTEADITVISDTVPGWQEVRTGGKRYLVSGNLSLEIIEEAERAGYAAVWSESEYPVRLAALLGRAGAGEVKPIRRPLERPAPVRQQPAAPGERYEDPDEEAYEAPNEPPVRHRAGASRDFDPVDWARGETRRPAKMAKGRKAARTLRDEPEVIPQRYVPRQIVSFSSAKGGKGKSTLTAATAVLLAADPRIEASVVAVDFDPFGGDLAGKLGVSPRYTLLDWINGAIDDISRCLTPVPLPDSENTLMVLAGPEREEDGVALTAEVAQNLLTTLQRRFDIVLVDTHPELLNATYTALENSSHIFLIDNPDVTALKKTYQRARTLADLGMLDRLHMVLNRIPRQNVMRLDVVEEIPSSTDVIRIPEDIGIQVAVNRIEPIGLSRRTKKFSRAMTAILKQIVPGYTEVKQKTGFKLNLFHRKDVAF